MKKKCWKCKEKIEKDFKFCPICGAKQKTNGLLDEIEDLMKEETMEFSFDSLFRNFSKLMQNLTNQIENEMKKIDKKIKPLQPEELPKKGKGISIKINFSTGKPEIKVIKFNEKEKEKSERKKLETFKQVSSKQIKAKQIKEKEKEKLKQLQLPHEEAKTKIKRLSDKLIYEIDLPGVKSMANIEIKQLENSTEIKAISKDKIYFKLIPIALPILNCEFKHEKLYIYFKPEF